jgi:hypothetical protein
MENVDDREIHLKTVFERNAYVPPEEKTRAEKERQEIVSLWFKYLDGELDRPENKYEYEEVRYHAKDILREEHGLFYATDKQEAWCRESANRTYAREFYEYKDSIDHSQAFRVVATRNAFYGAQHLVPMLGFLKEVVSYGEC